MKAKKVYESYGDYYHPGQENINYLQFESQLKDEEKREYEKLEREQMNLETELSAEKHQLRHLQLRLRQEKSQSKEKEMEYEDWAGQVSREYGHNVLDLLHSGYSLDHKKKELVQRGISEKEAQDLIDNYDYYTGENEEEIEDLKEQIKEQKKVISELEDREADIIDKQEEILKNSEAAQEYIRKKEKEEGLDDTEFASGSMF